MTTKPKLWLSIDGGGIRGIGPAAILAGLEASTGRATADLFDGGIIGTSTGGILALALGQGVPASALQALYATSAPKIFTASWLQKLKTLGGMIDGPKYSNDGLKAAIAAHISDTATFKTPVTVITTNLSTADLTAFSFLPTGLIQSVNPTVAALATSAAPTYFPPVRDGQDWLCDGGLLANNPTPEMWWGFHKGGPQPGDIILSLGTAGAPPTVISQDPSGWGPIKWGVHLISFMMSCAQDNSSEHAALPKDVTVIRLLDNAARGPVLALDETDQTKIAMFVDYWVQHTDIAALRAKLGV